MPYVVSYSDMECGNTVWVGDDLDEAKRIADAIRTRSVKARKAIAAARKDYAGNQGWEYANKLEEELRPMVVNLGSIPDPSYVNIWRWNGPIATFVEY